MSATLHEQLAELAESAAPAAMPAGDLWRRGRRRQWRVRAAYAAGSTLLVGALAGITVPWANLDAGPEPAADPGRGGIPTTVHEPDPWSEGTDDTGAPGRLSVLASATRFRPEGWWSGHSAWPAYYGVSATDGSVRFLDLPTVESGEQPGLVNGGGEVTLSPDGNLVAFVQRTDEGEPAPLAGWGVYDSVTGRTTYLRDPRHSRLWWSGGSEPEFTADSRYLVVSYNTRKTTSNRRDVFVAFDVRSGERHVVEPPGEYWLPNVGSGLQGVVWARKNTIHTFDPATGERTQVTAPQGVVDAAYSPDGRWLAWIGKPGADRDWKLYVRGPAGRVRSLPTGDWVSRIQGWVDNTHVVVDSFQRDTFQVMDVRDGSVEPLELHWGASPTYPVFASGLWSGDPVEAVEPEDVGDPRARMRQGVVGAAVMAAVLLLLLRWRRRARA